MVGRTRAHPNRWTATSAARPCQNIKTESFAKNVSPCRTERDGGSQRLQPAPSSQSERVLRIGGEEKEKKNRRPSPRRQSKLRNPRTVGRTCENGLDPKQFSP